jgi:putative ABC transport system permease protein
MLRAIGFTRRRLSRAFALEGALYALPAAVLGALAGVGIGWLVALAAGGLFTQPGHSLDLPLVVEPTSLAVGALAGLVISLTTIWLTSVRIARLNVIRAIRELPEPRAARLRRSTLVLGGLGVLLGAAAGLTGYVGEDPVTLLLGVPVTAFSAGPLLRRVLPERAARLLVAGAVLGWGLGALPLFPDIMGRPRRCGLRHPGRRAHRGCSGDGHRPGRRVEPAARPARRRPAWPRRAAWPTRWRAASAPGCCSRCSPSSCSP